MTDNNFFLIPSRFLTEFVFVRLIHHFAQVRMFIANIPMESDFSPFYEKLSSDNVLNALSQPKS